MKNIYTVSFKSFLFIIFCGVLSLNNLSAQVCSCPSNLVLNPSFENGTTSWNWSGGNLNPGGGAVKCGSYSGDFQITTSNGWVAQTIGTNLAAGTVLNVSVYSGTHNSSTNNWIALQFFDASWGELPQSVYIQVDKVLEVAPFGPQLYTMSATVPATCVYTQVAFGGDGDWTKTEQWCVPLNPPAPTGCGANLFNSNPGFETGTISNWNSYGNFNTSNDAYSGSYAGHINAGVAGGGAFLVPATAGSNYEVKAYAKAAAGTSWGAVELKFYDATQSQIGSGVTAQIDRTTYAEYSVNGVAPAGTAYVGGGLWKDAPGEIWVDNYCLMNLSVLPVQILELSTTLINSKVVTSWKANDLNSISRFEIERSTNGTNFQVVGTQNTLYSSVNSSNFIFNDNITTLDNESVLYYRIKAVEKNGGIRYSKISIVRLQSKNTVTVFPNPFVNEINISYNATAASSVKINLLNVNGKIVKTYVKNVAKGLNQLQLNDLSTLAGESYLLEIVNQHSGERTVYKIRK